MKTMKHLLLQAPDSQICSATKNKIKQWSDEPSALEILETLDFMIHGATASSFAVSTVEMLLEQALIKENKKYEDLIVLAVWRNT